MRSIAVLGLLVSTALAHGGAFRPPPRPGPRDPVRGPARPSGRPTTTFSSAVRKLAPWEFWWNLNRDRFLDVRARMLERTPTTGPRGRLFDRAKLRARLTPELMKVLEDRDDEVRGAAAIALGKFGAVPAAPVLRRMAATDDSEEARDAAVLGLALLRDGAQRDYLRRVLREDRHPRHRRGFAAVGLGWIKDDVFLREVLETRKVAGSVTDREQMLAMTALGLSRAGGKATFPLLAKTAARRKGVRPVVGLAAGGLGPLGERMAVPEVIRVLRDRRARDEARLGAAIAAGMLLQPDEVGLVDALARVAGRAKDANLRAMATIALGSIGGVRAVEHLKALVRTADRERGFLYLALGMTRSDEAGPLLEHLFKRLKNNQHRSACALGMALCGYRDARDLIREPLADRNPDYLAYGMLAFAMLGDREALPLVRKELTRSRQPAVLRHAALSLALLEGRAASRTLVGLLEGRRPDGKRLIGQAHGYFLRGAVVEALGHVGTAGAADPLLAILRDGKRQGTERALAVAALGRIADGEYPSALSKLAFDLNYHVTVDALTELLRVL